MPMLTLNGQVANTFVTDATKNRETGEAIPAKTKVQLLCENALRNGEMRLELVTLAVEDIGPYEKLVGQVVRVPVGVFAVGGSVQYFALRGQSPEHRAA